MILLLKKLFESVIFQLQVVIISENTPPSIAAFDVYFISLKEVQTGISKKDMKFVRFQK